MQQEIQEEDKKNKSFWNRLFRLSRKSNAKDKIDFSFEKRDTLYGSFRSTKLGPPGGSTSSDETGNFTTLESSAFMQVHEDAGILFVKKNPAVNSTFAKGSKKHVQFAPTPMNKHHRADAKATPFEQTSDEENKENLGQFKTWKASWSIPRLEKNRKQWTQKETALGNRNNSREAKLVDVTYVEGSQLKTTCMPRTSTKITLFDRKEGSLPHINVSGIAKYGSLPGAAKSRPDVPKWETKSCAASESGNANTRECFFLERKRQLGIARKVETEWRCQSLRNINKSSFGVSNPSRIFEQRKSVQSHRCSLGPDVMHGENPRGPQMCPLRVETKTASEDFMFPQRYSKDDPEQISNGEANSDFPSSKSQTYTSFDDHSRQIFQKKSSVTFEPNARWVKLENNINIPNKAINEVGLPIISKDRNGARPEKSYKSRSMSPRRIPLSETRCIEKTDCLKKVPVDCTDHLASRKLEDFVSVEGKQKCVLRIPHNALQSKLKKSINYFPPVSENRKELPKTNVLNSEQRKASEFVGETRKRAIRLAMCMQKRKATNKICEYPSKQTEEGFSSMADDECSFNCSCPSCVERNSRVTRRNVLKHLLSRNLTEYFGRESAGYVTKGQQRMKDDLNYPRLERPPEKCTSEEREPLSALRTLRYDCNDFFRREQSESVPHAPDIKNVVENMYENITWILNSATKNNFRSCDVNGMFCTSLCSPTVSAHARSSAGGQSTAGPSVGGRRSRHGRNGESMPDPSSEQVVTPMKSSPFFNDSVVLLQEIFQKLSRECKELLQPERSSVSSGVFASSDASRKSFDAGKKYVNELVKNLQSKELSEEDFANVIGDLAQNIFIETKAKREKRRRISRSKSLPDLKKEGPQKVRAAASLENMCSSPERGTLSVVEMFTSHSVNSNDGEGKRVSTGDTSGSRGSREGRSPTMHNSNRPSTKLSSNVTENEDSKCSDAELLENAIRLGMGLSPMDERKRRAPLYSASPAKATKYKSKDVLSGKGKLKLRIYNNSGLVTIHVIRAAKLHWSSGKDLNSYVKVSMAPDDLKRVHWRTSVKKAMKNPVFNQKFSFELIAEDEFRRLVFSVWHRDYQRQRSELIGCMSFSVKHVLEKTHSVDGWYRLLREGFGTKKHFAANSRKNCCPYKQED